MTNKLQTLLDQLNAEAATFSGRFGLAAQAVDADTPILFQAEEIFPTASVIKLAVVAEYLAQVETGHLSPGELITLDAADKVGGAGVLLDLQPGLTLTLQDLAMLTITLSDNTASNLLIKTVGGLAPVNARLASLGMPQTTLGRLFIFDSPADNTGSPADFLTFLLALARGQMVSPAASRQLLAMMERQQYTSYIPRYLPFHPFAAEYGLPQAVNVANKVGMLPGVVNDAALLTTPTNRYALVIFSRDCADYRPDPDNEGALLVARLAKMVYDYFVDGVGG